MQISGLSLAAVKIELARLGSILLFQQGITFAVRVISSIVARRRGGRTSSASFRITLPAGNNLCCTKCIIWIVAAVGIELAWLGFVLLCQQEVDSAVRVMISTVTKSSQLNGVCSTTLGGNQVDGSPPASSGYF